MKISAVLALVLLAGSTATAPAQTADTSPLYVISTAAGSVPATTPVPGLSLSVGTVWGIANDASGNVYVSSSDLNLVFRLDPNGLLTRIAGNSRAGYSGDGGPATSAQLNGPHGVTVDASGNLFIADYGNRRIRRVSPDGIITTVAGNGACCFSGDGGPASSAQLQTPFGVAVDSAGALFVADLYGSRVRKVSPDGIISTLAGDGSYAFSGDGGPAVNAKLNGPLAVAVDGDDNVFISDYNNRRIRKVTRDGSIATVVGGANPASDGDGVPALNANLYAPLGLTFDNAGNLLIADYARLRKVSTSGIITTAAGGGKDWFNTGDGGPATGAAIMPVSVAVDVAGNLSLVDALYSSHIRRVSSEGIITTVAGNGASCCFSGDGGPATGAQLNDPASVAVDSNGNLYIADARNQRIRKVSPDGSIATVANACYSPDDIWSPCGVAVDRGGNLYVSYDDGVFKLSPGGAATKLADHGIGLAFDAVGNLFIADSHSNVIRKLSPDGVSTTVAGTGTAGYSGDGGPAASAQLSLPLALAVDQAGNLYIADSGNKRIRMVSSDGVIATIADATGDLDGNLASIGLGSLLVGLAVDTAGNVFFEELSASFRRIRRLSRDGTVTTIAGAGVPGYSGDGGAAAYAQLNPSADELGNTLAIDAAGNLYVADGGNNAVRILRPVNQ